MYVQMHAQMDRQVANIMTPVANRMGAGGKKMIKTQVKKTVNSDNIW